MQWTVLVPIKALAGAKSRLADASADVAAHRRLVLAMRRDTLDAIHPSTGVSRVVLVVDQPTEPSGDEMFVQTEPGLNAGLTQAAAAVVSRWPGDGVVAVVADLPALRPAEFSAALASAEANERSFVPDAAGTGTTMLAARPGIELLPRFGAGSARRHARVATAIEAGVGLRYDIDTRADLEHSLVLRLGRATAGELADVRAGRTPPCTEPADAIG